MNFRPTQLAGVIVVEPKVFRDERGFFFESWRADRWKEGGVTGDFWATRTCALDNTRCAPVRAACFAAFYFRLLFNTWTQFLQTFVIVLDSIAPGNLGSLLAQFFDLIGAIISFISAPVKFVTDIINKALKPVYALIDRLRGLIDGVWNVVKKIRKAATFGFLVDSEMGTLSAKDLRALATKSDVSPSQAAILESLAQLATDIGGRVEGVSEYCATVFSQYRVVNQSNPGLPAPLAELILSDAEPTSAPFVEDPLWRCTLQYVRVSELRATFGGFESWPEYQLLACNTVLPHGHKCKSILEGEALQALSAGNLSDSDWMHESYLPCAMAFLSAYGPEHTGFPWPGTPGENLFISMNLASVKAREVFGDAEWLPPTAGKPLTYSADRVFDEPTIVHHLQTALNQAASSPTPLRTFSLQARRLVDGEAAAAFSETRIRQEMLTIHAPERVTQHSPTSIYANRKRSVLDPVATVTASQTREWLRRHKAVVRTTPSYLFPTWRSAKPRVPGPSLPIVYHARSSLRNLLHGTQQTGRRLLAIGPKTWNINWISNLVGRIVAKLLREGIRLLALLMRQLGLNFYARALEWIVNIIKTWDFHAMLDEVVTFAGSDYIQQTLDFYRCQPPIYYDARTNPGGDWVTPCLLQLKLPPELPEWWTNVRDFVIPWGTPCRGTLRKCDWNGPLMSGNLPGALFSSDFLVVPTQLPCSEWESCEAIGHDDGASNLIYAIEFLSKEAGVDIIGFFRGETWFTLHIRQLQVIAQPVRYLLKLGPRTVVSDALDELVGYKSSFDVRYEKDLLGRFLNGGLFPIDPFHKFCLWWHAPVGFLALLIGIVLFTYSWLFTIAFVGPLLSYGFALLSSLSFPSFLITLDNMASGMPLKELIHVPVVATEVV